MNDTLDALILDSFARLCVAELDAGAQGRLESGTFEAALWAKIDALGLPGLLTDYDGELDAPQRTAQAVGELCGYHAVPLPFIEHMVAREALARAGIAPPAGCWASAS